MKLLALGIVVVAGAVAVATDHNNIDGGRPLRFDDAYSIAFRERSLEFGLSLDTFRKSSPSYGLKAEFKVGFAKNQDLGVAIEPSYSTANREYDFGNIELSYFNGLRREIDNSPAVGVRVDLNVPTGREAHGLDLRLRGILTKAYKQYDRLHFNADVLVASDPRSGERAVAFGAILGYSTPLGYPTRFNQTLVAEIAMQQGRLKSEGWAGSVGLGLRRQVGVRSVVDVGVTVGDFVNFTAGYSVGF